MGRLARRLVLGLVVLAAVWGASTPWSPASSSPTGPAVVTGAVDETGAGVVPAGWTITHDLPGRYVVRASGRSVDLDVTGWDAAGAELTVIPVGDGGVEVGFVRDGAAVDSPFRWRALVSSGG